MCYQLRLIRLATGVMIEDLDFFLPVLLRIGRSNLPTNRMAVARYLAHDCPRLRFLLYLLKIEGSQAESGIRPRFLIYCNWPYTR